MSTIQLVYKAWKSNVLANRGWLEFEELYKKLPPLDPSLATIVIDSLLSSKKMPLRNDMQWRCIWEESCDGSLLFE